MNQKEVFLNGEGDAWYRRYLNSPSSFEKRKKEDTVVNFFREVEQVPSRILEVGSGDGWRLEVLRQLTGAACMGIDPSREAVQGAVRDYPEIRVNTGTADDLPFEDDLFDAVIFGTCLYLCEPEDLFRVAAEADRVLADQGLIVIRDFYTETPYRNRYSHLEGVYSFKMDYSRLFSWHPAYRCEYFKLFPHHGGSMNNPDDRMSLVALRKDLGNAYIDNPWDR